MASIADSLTPRLAWVSLRVACRNALQRVDVHVEGLEHLPATGPAVIAARHFHHLYDGCALLTLAPRPLRAVVALDWLKNPIGHRLMTIACHAAGWPVVSRPARPAHLPPSAFRLQRAAARESVALLRAGRLLLIFPEGYPTIDPGYTPKTHDDEVLPFQPGFLRFAALAERDGRTRVPIVPVGLEYRRDERWGVTVRFGAPVGVDPALGFAEQSRVIEQRVRLLSGLSANLGASARDHPGR